MLYSLTASREPSQKNQFLFGFIQDFCMEPLNVGFLPLVIKLLHSCMLILCHIRKVPYTFSKEKITHTGDKASLDRCG